MTSHKTTLLKTVIHFIPYRICLSDQLKFEDWAISIISHTKNSNNIFFLFKSLSLSFTSFFLSLTLVFHFIQSGLCFVHHGGPHTCFRAEADIPREGEGQRAGTEREEAS